MTITYFPETETLANSRSLILDNDATILSRSAGSDFPAVNVAVGQPFFHTVQKKLYTCTAISPSIVWTLEVDLNKTPTNKEDSDAAYATKTHNHFYDVNNTWLASPGNHVRVYGNTRQMVFRTDGITEYVNGIGAWAFLWMYGGDALANRVFGVGFDGNMWSKTYGWLHDRFLSKNQSDTLSAGVAIYANNGAWSGDPTIGKGKIQYFDNTWYLNSAAESNYIAVFRRGNTNKLVIDAEGYLWSSAFNDYYHNLFTGRTSYNRPGVTKLYRREHDSGFSVQTYYINNRWRLDGYWPNDTIHAGCEVAYADRAGSAGSADYATRANSADYATPRVAATRAGTNYYAPFEYSLGTDGVSYYLLKEPTTPSNCNCNCN